ncbi:MAG: hypothetical protein WC365_09415 [Candidatus Babeliales bacterium]
MAEIIGIADILTDKNLMRLLWWAEGLKENASQLQHTRNTQIAVKAHDIAT